MQAMRCPSQPKLHEDRIGQRVVSVRRNLGEPQGSVQPRRFFQRREAVQSHLLVAGTPSLLDDRFGQLTTQAVAPMLLAARKAVSFRRCRRPASSSPRIQRHDRLRRPGVTAHPVEHNRQEARRVPAGIPGSKGQRPANRHTP